MSNLKKRYRLKIKNLIILSFIIITLSVLSLFLFIINSDSYKLKKIGYSEIEVKNLKQKMSKYDIDLVLKYPYISYLIELLEEQEYNSLNLSKYIDYINNITGEYKISDIVYIVNNGIEYSYSAKLNSLINSKYFILDRLDRYIDYTEKKSIDEVITYVNSNRDYNYYSNIKDTDTSKKELMLVNKYYNLSKDYVSNDLVTMDSNYDNKTNSKLDKVAYDAFKKLSDDARREGYYIYNNSAYRSYDYQLSVYNNYKNNNGLDYAEKIAARPSFSEHQTGLALDVGVKKDRAVGLFEDSKEFTWMKENSYKYGFILRYPKGKEDITGYRYEAWHYRYVGVEAATYIYENDITFEEYYAYFVEKK